MAGNRWARAADPKSYLMCPRAAAGWSLSTRGLVGTLPMPIKFHPNPGNHREHEQYRAEDERAQCASAHEHEKDGRRDQCDDCTGQAMHESVSRRCSACCQENKRKCAG